MEELYKAGAFIHPDLLISIPDPEKAVPISGEQLTELQRKDAKEGDRRNTEEWLYKDYIPLNFQAEEDSEQDVDTDNEILC